MALYNGDKQIHELYNGDTYIEELYNGDTKIFDAGWNKTVSGTAPLTLPNARAKETIWKIEGQSKQGILPDGYTQLEYIENTNQAYIMTGLVPGGTKLAAEVKFSASANAVSSNYYPCLFSCFTDEGTSSNSNVYNFGIYGGKWRYKLLTNQGYGANVDTNIHTIHWNKDNGTRLDDGATWVASRVIIPSSNNRELPLFVRNSTGIIPESFFVGKIYYAKFWNDSNVLVRNFIPAKNSSNVIGMYDLVTNQFFNNAGTGTFTAGHETPTPTAPVDVKGVGDLNGSNYVVPITISDGTATTTYNINLSAPLQKIGTYKDSVESDGTLTAKVGKTTLSAGTHTISDAMTNSPYLCTQQSSGTLSGQSITLDTGVTNADVYYVKATATETTVSVPSISTIKGTNYIDVTTEIQPSDVSVTYRSKYQ